MNKTIKDWEYISTIVLAVCAAVWAYYDYKNDPAKIPFEPALVLLGYIFGLIGRRLLTNKTAANEANNDTEKANNTPLMGNKNTVAGNDNTFTAQEGIIIGDNNTINKEINDNRSQIQKADKIYNINKIDKADFH